MGRLAREKLTKATQLRLEAVKESKEATSLQPSSEFFGPIFVFNQGTELVHFMKVYFTKVYFLKVYFPKVYFPKVYLPKVYFPKVFSKCASILGPNFFDPKVTQPKLYQTERTRRLTYLPSFCELVFIQ